MSGPFFASSDQGRPRSVRGPVALKIPVPTAPALAPASAVAELGSSKPTVLGEHRHTRQVGNEVLCLDCGKQGAPHVMESLKCN
jgi:hypothetical protein